MELDGIAYISEMPELELKGGVFTVTAKSGRQIRRVAYPAWLMRLYARRALELLEQHDCRRTG